MMNGTIRHGSSIILDPKDTPQTTQLHTRIKTPVNILKQASWYEEFWVQFKCTAGQLKRVQPIGLR